MSNTTPLSSQSMFSQLLLFLKYRTFPVLLNFRLHLLQQIIVIGQEKITIFYEEKCNFINKGLQIIVLP